jgi:hypothetical protein
MARRADDCNGRHVFVRVGARRNAPDGSSHRSTPCSTDWAEDLMDLVEAGAVSLVRDDAGNVRCVVVDDDDQ